MGRTRAEVEDALIASRGDRTGSLPWTLGFLAAADVQFRGRWREIEIDAGQALAIVLPAHRGEPCRGDRLLLVPDEGGTVAEAAARLTADGEEYRRVNPTCWSRIERAMREPISRVVLASAPLDVPEHRGLTERDGALYHLDGFHRLVGWALAGRLSGDVRIMADVAGEMPGLKPRPTSFGSGEPSR